MSRNMAIIRDAVVYAFIVFASLTSTAHAYIDPGSGGVIVTAILGFFAAIGYTFRKWFYKLKSVFVSSKEDPEDEDD